MKVLFLTENFPPELNAAATRVYERACYWQKSGHDVTILTTAPNFPKGILFQGYKNKWFHQETLNGLNVIRVKTFISANQGFFLRSLDFVSFMMSAALFGSFLKRPDVIMFTSPQFFTAIAGWLLSIRHRRPFVFELGDLWPESIKGVGLMADSLAYKTLEKIELFLYRKSKKVVALTPSFKKNLIERGIDSHKVEVVLNAVDLTLYSPREKDKTLLETYHLKDKFIIGYIGTFGMAHDLPKFASVFKQVEKLYPNIHFLFVGDGADKERLVQKIHSENVSNTLVLPLQPKEKIPALWSLCDVALVHLKDDPLFTSVIPSKIFEAMGMGLPLLCLSPGGESKHLVEKHQCGLWLSSSYTVEGLLAVLKKLYTSPQDLEVFKKNSHKASRLYSREAQAEAVMAILDKIKKSEGN